MSLREPKIPGVVDQTLRAPTPKDVSALQALLSTREPRVDSSGLS